MSEYLKNYVIFGIIYFLQINLNLVALPPMETLVHINHNQEIDLRSTDKTIKHGSGSVMILVAEPIVRIKTTRSQAVYKENILSKIQHFVDNERTNEID